MSKPTTRKAIERKSANRDVISLKSVKLTDLQRFVLSGAAERADGAATLPEQMTEKAAQKLAAALIEKGLVREVSAKAGIPVWRRNEEGRGCALVITKLGKEAIKGGDDRRADDANVETPSASSMGNAAPSQTAESSQPQRTIPRQGNKLAEVIALLRRKQGAGIEELTSATGWLPHTTRAALTGLRKRGYAIERSRSEQGGSVYRIVTSAAPALAA
jgi:Protein of unknown function (DUF3489)